jgi:hypothetical protein
MIALIEFDVLFNFFSVFVNIFNATLLIYQYILIHFCNNFLNCLILQPGLFMSVY